MTRGRLPIADDRHGGDLCVVFDGDDTLWITEPLYDEARSEVRSVVEKSGLDGAEWEQLERRIDVENVAVLGHSPDRFPRSCRQAYEALSASLRFIPDPAVANEIEQAARSVFSRPALMMPGAFETLQALKRFGARLGLLTKGDQAVQRKRIADSSLSPFFDQVSIVPVKTPDAIREIVNRLCENAKHVWVVGNSLRSDILPALAAGVNAVWIDAHVWEYERGSDVPVDHRLIRAETLSEVLRIVAL